MNSRARRSIFGPPSDHPQGMVQSVPRAISESRSSARRSSQATEDQLRQTSNLIVSVETALERAGQLERRMREAQRANLTAQFVPRIQQPGERFNVEIARNNLQVYHIEIVGMQRLIQDYRLFQLSCLSNFENIDTAVRSEYSPEEAVQRLHHHLQRLKELRGDLLQNLHEYRQEIEPSGLVERIRTLEADLNELKLYTERNLTDINLMMINVLKHLHHRQQSFVKEFQKNATLYGRLATVLDNLEAMHQQSKHMEQQRRVMRSHFTNLTAGSYGNAVKATASYRSTLAERQHIYESNLKMLTRMAGQTCIADYHILLEKYRNNFIRYGKNIEQFDVDQVKFDKIFKLRQEAKNLGRVVVTHSREEDIAALSKVYNSILALDVPSELTGFRESTLQEIERDMGVVGVVLPDRDRHASSINIIKSRQRFYAQYFEKLESRPVQFLLESGEEAKLYLHELIQAHPNIMESHQRQVCQQYQQWFKLVITLRAFVQELTESNFRVVRSSFQTVRSNLLANTIKEHSPKLNEQYRPGLPLGLERGLFSIIKDSILLGDIFDQTQLIVADVATRMIPLETEWTFELFDNLLPAETLMGIKLINLRNILWISEGNQKLKELLLDIQLGIYKQQLLKEMQKRIDFEPVKLEEDFTKRYQKKFVSWGTLCYVLSRHSANNNFYLPDFYELMEVAIKQIARNWKQQDKAEKVAVLVSVSMLQDLVKIHNSRPQIQSFFKQTLSYLNKLLRNDLCLERTVKVFDAASQLKDAATYHYILLSLLQERSELVYNPIYVGTLRQVETEVNIFGQSLKGEGWALLETGCNLGRMNVVVGAIVAEKDMGDITQNTGLNRVQRLALLTSDVNSIKKLTDQKVRPEPADRIRIYTGKEHKVIDIYKLYLPRSENLPSRFNHWFNHIFSAIRKPSYDAQRNQPADRNMRTQYSWAFLDPIKI